MAKATTYNKKEPQQLKLQKLLKLFCHTTAIKSMLNGQNRYQEKLK